MKLTEAGIPVGGVGGSGVFVNSERIKDGGTATTDGQRVFYQSDIAQVRSCALDGSDDRLVHNGGASLIVAGGGQWAVWLADVGLVTSWGLRLRDAAVMAMTDAGDLLVLISYSTGKGLAMYRPGSSTAYWALPDADPIIRYPYPQAFALDVERVVWANPAGQLFSRGLPAPRQVASAFDPLVAVRPDGAVWIGYHTNDGRALLHPIEDTSRGYVLAEGLTFGTTATGQCFGYSQNAAESQMVVEVIDWSRPLVSLAPQVPDALRPPAPVAFAGTWWADDSAPGTVAIGSPTYTRPRHRCVIAGEADILNIPVERRLGLLVYLTPADDIAAVVGRAIAFAQQHDLVMFVYDDARIYRYAAIEAACGSTRWVPMPQWYVRSHGHHDEDAATFARDVIAQARAFGGRPFLPVIRGTSPSVVPPPLVVEALNELIRQGACALPGYLGPLFFGWARGDGPIAIPAIRPAIDLWLSTPTTVTNPAAWIAATFPEDPPVPEPMPIPAGVKATIQQFAARFPLPQGDGSEGWLDTAYRNPPSGWMARLAQQLCFSHGADYGQKRRGPGAPLSAGSFAMRAPGGMHVWDILISTGSGHPTLNVNGPEYYWVTDQEFVPVSAVNHLDVAPPTNRPTLTLPFWGATAFDLAAAGAAGDWRYYELLKTLKLVPRVNFYVTINAPGRYYRDFPTGMAQMRVLLPRMVQDGMKGQFIFLVGTTPDGVSRSEALNRIRQMDALLRQFRAAVRGVQIGNEVVYAGLEEPYVSESAFCLEVEAIVDPSFPLTWGAGHGGGGVNMQGGSYLVHHSDRDLSPDAAGAILAEAMRVAKRPIVDDEPRRIEQGGSGQSTGDLNFVRGLITNAKRYGYGLTIHPAAGRGCNVDLLDDVQRQALALTAAEVGTGPTPPIPPPTGDPILDADMRVDSTWYPIFVSRSVELRASIVKEYTRLNGHGPAESDIQHNLWRACVERDRWHTLRRAMSGVEG